MGEFRFQPESRSPIGQILEWLPKLCRLKVTLWIYFVNKWANDTISQHQFFCLFLLTMERWLIYVGELIVFQFNHKLAYRFKGHYGLGINYTASRLKGKRKITWQGAEKKIMLLISKMRRIRSGWIFLFCVRRYLPQRRCLQIDFSKVDATRPDMLWH